MITNLLASIVVTLVTNRAEAFPQHMVPYPPSLGQETLALFRYHMEADQNPTNKTVTTTILERKTVSFEFDGQKRELVIDKPVINWVESFKLETSSEWKKE